MVTPTDPVLDVQVALRKLARDPRALALKIAQPMELLHAAIAELAERQRAIASAVLEIDRYCDGVIDRSLHDRLYRSLYRPDLPRVQADD